MASPLEHQMRHRDKEMVPRFLVQAMFGLMLASVALVAYAQWADVPDAGVLIEAPIVEERSLTLESYRGGTFALLDADGSTVIQSSDPLAGFVGVVGRMIERERDIAGLETPAVLRIVRRDNGHIAVLDDETGVAMELIGYGADNVAAFGNLLTQD